VDLHRLVADEAAHVGRDVLRLGGEPCHLHLVSAQRAHADLPGERARRGDAARHVGKLRYASSAIATHWPASMSRSTAKFIMIIGNAPCSGPMRFATGTRQLSNDSSAVSLAHQPVFLSFLLTEKPGVPRSITTSEMPACPSPPVRTAQVTKSARVPDVMNVLAPLIT
jgi:hypothetical protein